MAKDFCVIRVEINPDEAYGFGANRLGSDAEDVVKNMWGYMLPWLTHRHGINSGEIKLNDGGVTVFWNYYFDVDDEATPEASS